MKFAYEDLSDDQFEKLIVFFVPTFAWYLRARFR